MPELLQVPELLWMPELMRVPELLWMLELLRVPGLLWMLELLRMPELLGYMQAVQAGFLQSSRRGSRARSWLPGSLWSPCHSRWTPESLTASDQSV